MNVQQKQQKGFTIIEVILVLAIAGLIFLMVFLALPALQRGQRNTQRKNDLSRVLSAVQNYQSNSQGKVPKTQTDIDSFKTNYLKTSGDSFADPDGTDYTLTLNSSTISSGDVDHVIYFSPGYKCGSGGALTAASGNNVAVLMKLEGSGVDCENN